METISEETANKLAEQFEKSRHSFIEASKCTTALLDTIKSSILNQLTRKYVYYCGKFIRASFLTRWYWKYKMDESQLALEKFLLLIHQRQILA